MGAASCKSLKSSLHNQHSDVNKNIVIGVFGLDDAGKTSTVKALEGDPTENVLPTMDSKSVTITYPPSEKTTRLVKSKAQQSVRIIDVSGERRFRQRSWSQFYDQIDGFIVVVDASERSRLRENQEMLEELLRHDQLRDKPILILANKQDRRGAVSNEYDLKRKLNIERLKAEYKLELCSALPQDDQNSVDESIQQGFAWLIQAINDHYTELNTRLANTGNMPTDKQVNRSAGDDNGRSTSHRSKITSEELPDINLNKSRTREFHDNEDAKEVNNRTLTKGFLRKKKVVGASNSTPFAMRTSRDLEPQAFRATYESFPEETPWSMSASVLKSSKSDDLLSRLNTRSSLKNDSSRRNVSPLVHDLKSYNNASASKREDDSAEEEERNFYQSQRSKPTNQFDASPFSPSRFSSNRVKPTSSIYSNADQSAAKSTTHFTNKNDYSRKHSRYDEDEDDYHRSPTKPTTKSHYDDDDHYSSPKAPAHSMYNKANRSFPSSGPISHSRFEDDDYPSSSSSKPARRSKYDDDDDDNDDDSYPNEHRKTNYSSSYNHYNGTNGSRSRFGNESFFTSNSGRDSASRSRKSTFYDD